MQSQSPAVGLACAGTRRRASIDLATSMRRLETGHLLTAPVLDYKFSLQQLNRAGLPPDSCLLTDGSGGRRNGARWSQVRQNSLHARTSGPQLASATLSTRSQSRDAIFDGRVMPTAMLPKWQHRNLPRRPRCRVLALLPLSLPPRSPFLPAVPRPEEEPRNQQHLQRPEKAGTSFSISPPRPLTWILRRARTTTHRCRCGMRGSST